MTEETEKYVRFLIIVWITLTVLYEFMNGYLLYILFQRQICELHFFCATKGLGR